MDSKKGKRGTPKDIGHVLNPVRVLIVDDHKIVRDGIRMVLGSFTEPDFTVYEADSIASAVEFLALNQIDLAFVDYRMGETTGDELVSFLNDLYPNVKAVGISNYDENTYVAKMVKAGAKGYVLKNVGVDELKECIDKVLSGSFYYSKEVLKSYLNGSQQTGKEKGEKEGKVAGRPMRLEDFNLSSRDIDIIKLVAKEHTNEEIADTLGLSKRTIDNQRNSIMHRLHVRNTVGLIKFAFQYNLIEE
jgi:DNA-binding NarL/FixJ family response regulator